MAASVALAAPPDSFRIPADDLRSAGWMEVQAVGAYSPQWFAERYGVAPPSVDVQSVAGALGKVLVYLLREQSDAQTERLWRGLTDDLAPNEALGRRDDTIMWTVSPTTTQVESMLSLYKPKDRASPSKDSEWIDRDVPAKIDELRFAYELYHVNLAEREHKNGGVPVRLVFQRSFELERRGLRLPQRTSQVTLWVPRERSRTEELAKTLQQVKQPSETVLWKEGVVAVVLAFHVNGTAILKEKLIKAGYRAADSGS